MSQEEAKSYNTQSTQGSNKSIYSFTDDEVITTDQRGYVWDLINPNFSKDLATGKLWSSFFKAVHVNKDIREFYHFDETKKPLGSGTFGVVYEGYVRDDHS